MRIYLPEEERDTTVVICSELPNNANNEGSSITYSAHQIGAEVIRYHKLSLPVWTEYYPPETTDGTSETFELVVFSSYEIRERAPYLGETRLTLGEPTWKSLGRETVEVLVGQECERTQGMEWENHSSTGRQGARTTVHACFS